MKQQMDLEDAIEADAAAERIHHEAPCDPARARMAEHARLSRQDRARLNRRMMDWQRP